MNEIRVDIAPVVGGRWEIRMDKLPYQYGKLYLVLVMEDLEFPQRLIELTNSEIEKVSVEIIKTAVDYYRRRMFDNTDVITINPYDHIGVSVK